MSDDRLEQRLDALGEPPVADAIANGLPDGLRAATRVARHQQVASVALVASLVIGSAILAVVAMRPDQSGTITESGSPDRVAQLEGPKFMTVASHRGFDPFAKAVVVDPSIRPTVAEQALRLLPLTDERWDRLIEGEL